MNKNISKKVVIVVIAIVVVFIGVVIGYNVYQRQSELNDFVSNYETKKQELLSYDIADADLKLFITPEIDNLKKIDNEILSKDLNYNQIDAVKKSINDEADVIKESINNKSNELIEIINTKLNIDTFNDEETNTKNKIVNKANKLTEATVNTVSELYNNYLTLKKLNSEADELIQTNKDRIAKEQAEEEKQKQAEAEASNNNDTSNDTNYEDTSDDTSNDTNYEDTSDDTSSNNDNSSNNSSDNTGTTDTTPEPQIPDYCFASNEEASTWAENNMPSNMGGYSTFAGCGGNANWYEVYWYDENNNLVKA